MAPGFAPRAARQIDLAAHRPVERILDVAYSRGTVTRLVAERTGSVGRVVGLDINTAILAGVWRMLETSFPCVSRITTLHAALLPCLCESLRWILLKSNCSGCSGLSTTGSRLEKHKTAALSFSQVLLRWPS